MDSKLDFEKMFLNDIRLSKWVRLAFRAAIAADTSTVLEEVEVLRIAIQMHSGMRLLPYEN